MPEQTLAGPKSHRGKPQQGRGGLRDGEGPRGARTIKADPPDGSRGDLRDLHTRGGDAVLYLLPGPHPAAHPQLPRGKR